MSFLYLRRRVSPLTPGWTVTDPIGTMTFSSDVPYAGAAVGTDGQTVFIARETTDTDQGTFTVVARSGGTWYTRAVQPTGPDPSHLGNQERAIYYNILPTTGAGAYVFASQCAHWNEIGWQTPQLASGVDANFTYNSLKGYYSSDWTSIAPTEFTVYAFTTQNNTAGTYWQNTVQINNAVLGADGKAYVMARWVNSTADEFRGFFAQISGTTVTSSGQTTNMYTFSADGGKYFLDGSGNPWACSPSGTTLYLFSCVNGTPQASPTALTLNHGPDGIVWPAMPSSGTPLSNDVDFVYTNGVSQLNWVRIHYNGASWSKTSEEVIATGLSTGNAGNAWGPQKLRITRTPGGTLYATGHLLTGRLTANGDNDDDYIVYKRTGTNTWINFHQASAGREPVSIMNGGNNLLHIDSSPGGTVEAYTQGVF